MILNRIKNSTIIVCLIIIISDLILRQFVLMVGSTSNATFGIALVWLIVNTIEVLFLLIFLIREIYIFRKKGINRKSIWSSTFIVIATIILIVFII